MLVSELPPGDAWPDDPNNKTAWIVVGGWALLVILILIVMWLAGCVAEPEALLRADGVKIGFQPQAFEKMLVDAGNKLTDVQATADRIEKGVGVVGGNVERIGNTIEKSEQRGLVNVDARGGAAVVAILVAGVVLCVVGFLALRWRRYARTVIDAVEVADTMDDVTPAEVKDIVAESGDSGLNRFIKRIVD